MRARLPSGSMVPAGVAIGMARSASRLLRESSGSITTTAVRSVPLLTTWPTVLPLRAISTDSASCCIVSPLPVAARRSKAICTCWIGNWGSSCRSTTPGIGSIASRTCSPIRRSSTRSGPKILMAIALRTPESTSSMRWEMKPPMFGATPGSFRKALRSSAMAAGRFFIAASLNSTSTWARLTPAPSASPGARPVRTCTHSNRGLALRVLERARPARLVISSDTPG